MLYSDCIHGVSAIHITSGCMAMVLALLCFIVVYMQMAFWADALFRLYSWGFSNTHHFRMYGHGSCFVMFYCVSVIVSFAQICQRIFHSLQWRNNECDGISNHQPRDWLLNHLFRHWSKKKSKLLITGLCEGNSPVIGEFPAWMASNAENVSIWWCHHENPDWLEMLQHIMAYKMLIYWCLMMLYGFINLEPHRMW